MTNSVTLNGNSYNDGNTPPRNLGNGGHRDNLIPMIADGIADLAAKQAAAAGSASTASAQATAAAASAQTALNAPGTSATSTTSLTIGTGGKTLTIQAGKSLVVGMSVKVASTATPTNWMFGDVTAYDSGTGSITVNVTSTNGAGTLAAWTVSLSGPAGVAGTTGADGQSALTTRSARTANTMLAAADKGKLIDVTSGTFTQTFDACATLGNAWAVWIRNSGTGDITLDPNAAETIDGLVSFVMYPNEARLIQCDGTALRSIVVQPFYKVFTASGNFIKPPGYSYFDGLAWSGGSSGACGSGPSSSAWGGAGGGCFPFRIDASTLAASTSITVGAGGAARTAPGGGTTNGATGGGTSIGSLVSVFTNSYNNGGAINGYTQASSVNATGFEGALSVNNTTYCSSVYGGSAPHSGPAGTSGSSIYGGAAGGSVTSTSVVYSPGSSKFGGNGGTASYTGNGSDGAIPGGGGGASNAGGAFVSGAGGRGEVRIWGVC